MNLKDVISRKKQSIVDKWVHLFLDTYPQDTAKLLREKKDRFANPVGHSVRNSLDGLFDELIRGGDVGKVSSLLDEIIRVRAVQDFSAAEAVGVIVRLKDVLASELREELSSADKATYTELIDIYSEIDGMLLIGFEIFMKCREKIYEMKDAELRRNTYRLLQRANLVPDVQGESGQ